jgi:hypothetical protein
MSKVFHHSWDKSEPNAPEIKELDLDGCFNVVESNECIVDKINEIILEMNRRRLD